MTRSPLAYPLNRSADPDAGGAADLQTDIMRFMAILSLCLVAIFALVQSIPLQPAEPVAPVEKRQVTAAASEVEDVSPAGHASPAAPVDKRVDAGVALTRPKWKSSFVPRSKAAVPAPPEADVQHTASKIKTNEPAEAAASPARSEAEGFTLRFESDAALTRLVATNRVGLYALSNGRAQRMTVAESRISFWEASAPGTYHEMESNTVPGAVIEALARTGTAAAEVRWGVTLPGKLRSRLDELMLERRDGSLIIVGSGDIQWEDI